MDYWINGLFSVTVSNIPDARVKNNEFMIAWQLGHLAALKLFYTTQ
jgi:hypothetical protein